MLVRNQDHRPKDYTETDWYPRPSHADWTYIEKYGVKSSSGGGRASARETIGRVAAGAIAEKYLKLAYGVEIVAFVSSVGAVHLPGLSADKSDVHFFQMLDTISRARVDEQLTRCPDAAISALMKEQIVQARDAKDSIGGTVTCVIRNVPAGLGEPCFDKLEAKLAHAMLSIPATKGFEIGSGFKGTEWHGSKHNDPWVQKGDRLGTTTNYSGGIQGGISNGEHVYFKVAFKPPATIGQEQSTSTYEGDSGKLAARGRHDPCVVPRAVPIVEAMAALVMMDAVLAQQSRTMSRNILPSIDIPASMTGKRPDVHPIVTHETS
jgi:chorismate synthase